MLRRYGRRVANTLLPGALILNYHRVAEPGLDPWELRVSPRHFDEHLDVVRRLGRPTQLSQLTEMLRDGKPMKGAVAITFDDGYFDNYENARPLLEKHGIPATIFVVSGSIGSERGFWWDELAALLLRPGCLPSVLELSIHGKDHRIELHEATHYGEGDEIAHAWHCRRHGQECESRCRGARSREATPGPPQGRPCMHEDVAVASWDATSMRRPRGAAASTRRMFRDPLEAPTGDDSGGPRR